MIKQFNFPTTMWLLGIGCLLTTFLSSCDENSFSQVVKVEIPEHEPKVAMSALWLSADTTAYVHIDKSKAILDEENTPLPTDAVVKLFINGDFVQEATFSSSSQSGLPSDQYTFLDRTISSTAGDEYRLEATFDNLPVASATQIMPANVPINKVEYIQNGGGTPDGGQTDLFNVTFTDDGATEDYYMIKLYILTKHPDWPNPEDSITEFTSIYLESNDPTVTMARGSLLLSDKSFNGKTVTTKAQSYSWGVVQSGEAHLIHITKETYFYLKSIESYYNALDNPFAQPTDVYGNIKDGYGIFGLGNNSKLEF